MSGVCRAVCKVVHLHKRHQSLYQVTIYTTSVAVIALLVSPCLFCQRIPECEVLMRVA